MPGYYDNASPPEDDPSPCENCEYYDLVEGCSEGHEPESCPELEYEDEETRGCREYHKWLDDKWER